MRQSVRSKSWWNANLSRLKEIQARVLRQKRNNFISEEVYQEAKKAYQKVMHEIMKNSWDTFLTNTREAEVFRAYGYNK
jgi:hypothetical protein